MLIIWKFPESIAGRTKHPRRPHAGRVSETSAVDPVGFSDVSSRHPDIDRSKVLHPFGHERSTVIGISKPKLCRNQ